MSSTNIYDYLVTFIPVFFHSDIVTFTLDESVTGFLIKPTCSHIIPPNGKLFLRGYVVKFSEPNYCIKITSLDHLKTAFTVVENILNFIDNECEIIVTIINKNENEIIIQDTDYIAEIIIGEDPEIETLNSIQLLERILSKY